MTREQFCRLAGEIGAYAQQHPTRYRFKVAVLAAQGYAFIFGSILACCAVLVGAGLAFTQPWFWSLALHAGRLVILWVIFLIGLAVTLFSLVRSLFVPLPAPFGRRVQREEAPELFAVIDEVVAASAAPRPHTVMLTWDFNAAVAQRPRLGWLGGSRDFLVLGVPLMGALSPLQFKAVLAHEFAHLRGGHGRFANWIYRLRMIWAQLLERLVRRRQKLVGIVVAFFKWYSPRFNAYTYALARAQEFEADAWAAQVAGKQAAAEALAGIWVNARRLEEEFWQPLNLRANQERELPAGIFSRLLAHLREPADDAAQGRRIRAVLGRDTDPTHTHPSAAERMSALGLPATPEEVARCVRSPEGGQGASAAEVLLGQRLPEYLTELEGAWRLATSHAWQRRFDRAQAIRRRLEALDLEEVRTGASLPESTDWERVCLKTEIGDGKGETRGWVVPFVARWPRHARGRFTLGGLLLEAEDEAGVAHLEEAQRLDPRLATAATELVAAYLRRCGRTEEAAAQHLQAIRHHDQLDAARIERRQFTLRDRLLPHGLDAAAVADLRAQLAQHPLLRKAYVARKEVVHYADKPFYVVIGLVRSRWATFGVSRKIGAILREVGATLTVAGTRDYYLLVAANGRNRRIRKVRRIAGAQIYPVPRPRRWFAWWRRIPQVEPVAAAMAPPLPARPLPPPLPPVQAGPMLRPPGRGGRDPFAVAAALLFVAIPTGFVVYRATSVPDEWKALRQRWTDQIADASTAKLAEASEPIPINPNATTAENDRVLSLNWATRTMRDAYARSGRRNARWDTAALAFIDRALPWWAGCRATTVGTANLLPQADNLLRLGCDDPVVLLLAGCVKGQADPQSAEAGNLFSRAVSGLRETPYLRGVACVAAAKFVEDCDRRRDGTGQADPVKKWWLYWFRQALADGSFLPDEQVALAHALETGAGDHLFREYREPCCQALSTSSTVAPWLKLWLSGARHVDDAWQARGDGYANTVTADGWRGFAAGLALARADLTAAWKLEPRRPEAAAEMLNVVLGEDGRRGENERLWFDRAVHAEIDYHPAYQCMIYSLYPRWGGNRQAMLAFGTECARTGLFSTGVPMELHQAMLNVGWDSQDPGSAFREPRLYATLEAVFAGYENDASQQNRRVYFHGWHARAADLAGNDLEAYDVLRQVDFRLPEEVEAELNDGETGEAFLGRIAALGRAGGSPAAAAEQAARAGQTDRALALYRQALERVGSDRRATNYLQGKVDVLTGDQRLRNGEWISFQPAAGQGGTPVGWQSKLGNWRVEADGSLLGHCGASGLMLVSGMHVGPDFEVRGEMDFLPGVATEVQSGVVFGHPDFEGEDWRSLRLRRNNREPAVALLSQHWYDGPKQPISVPDHNTFALQSWRGRLTVMVNGRLVFRELDFPQGLVPSDDALVGLGGYSHQGNIFDVRYRKLQIRRLNAAPPMLVDGSAAPAVKNQSRQMAQR